jgi:hypothetical protein
MEIFRFIQQQFKSMLALDGLGKFQRNRQPAADRVCQFGHPVFSGTKLCSYGHHPA